MITQESIERVMDAAVIEEVIGEFVELKRKGATYVGKSPFREEKTASFYVVPAKNIFKDFSSGRGGNVVTFLMEVKNMSFPDAIQWLADKYQVQIERTHGDESPEEVRDGKSKREQALNLWRATIRRYMVTDEIPRKSTEQIEAQKKAALDEFCQERSLTPDDILTWQIGASPDQARYLTELIIEGGFHGLATELGICKTKESWNYDALRNRIIFPIHDHLGRIVAMAGRAIGDAKPKYINSPESFLYHKSRVLYGMHMAHKSIRANGEVMLVEGYMDVIAAHRAGMTNTVGYCAKQITTEQAKAIKRICSMAVLICEDNEASGAIIPNAMQLQREGIAVTVADLREGGRKQDVDDLVRTMGEEGARELITRSRMSIMEWATDHLVPEGASSEAKAKAAKELATLIAAVENPVLQDEYVALVCKRTGIKPAALRKLCPPAKPKETKKAAPRQEEVDYTQKLQLQEGEYMPEWVDVNEIKRNLFLQREEQSAQWPCGIYFTIVDRNSPRFTGVQQMTNFTIKPLMKVVDELDGRYLVQVFNGYKRHHVEIPKKGLVSLEAFKLTMVDADCFTESALGPFQFMKIAKWIGTNCHPCFEIKTLGHQPEGFFAFINAAVIYGAGGAQVVRTNDLGIIDTGKQRFVSPAASSIRDMFRQEDDMYENDSYLALKETQVTFAKWAQRFCSVYDDHGRIGVAFVIMTVYKDMIYRIGAKCPLLYLYGPKGSGKSAMGESIQNLFYSGTNAEGRLIQAVNMSPGMVTDFALASALRRFRNCPRLYNEYDPNLTESKYRGWFKGAFDGEGRERGVGESGAKKKTEIMKVQGTIMLAGQYLDNHDDGAVMTRSLNLRFSEEKNRQRTQEQKEAWRELTEWEQDGLNGCLIELLEIRHKVEAEVKEVFNQTRNQLAKDAKNRGNKVEDRLINNYALVCAFTKVVHQHITLPFNPGDLYGECLDRMVELSGMVNEDSVISRFWRVLEVLLDSRKIEYGNHYSLQYTKTVNVRESSKNYTKEFTVSTQVMYLRMDSLYGAYAKELRERGGKQVDMGTIMSYLKDQPYYIGLVPKVMVGERYTSAHAVNYSMMEEMGIGFINDVQARSTPKSEQLTVGAGDDDMPF